MDMTLDRMYDKQFEIQRWNNRLAIQVIIGKYIMMSAMEQTSWDVEYNNYFSSYNIEGRQIPSASLGLYVFGDYMMRKLWTEVNGGIPKNDARLSIDLGINTVTDYSYASRMNIHWYL